MWAVARRIRTLGSLGCPTPTNAPALYARPKRASTGTSVGAAVDALHTGPRPSPPADAQPSVAADEKTRKVIRHGGPARQRSRSHCGTFDVGRGFSPPKTGRAGGSDAPNGELVRSNDVSHIAHHGGSVPAPRWAGSRCADAARRGVQAAPSAPAGGAPPACRCCRRTRLRAAHPAARPRPRRAAPLAQLAHLAPLRQAAVGPHAPPPRRLRSVATSQASSAPAAPGERTGGAHLLREAVRVPLRALREERACTFRALLTRAGGAR